MNEQELLYLLSLKDISGIGNILSRRLLAHFHTAENIFKSSRNELIQVEGIGENQAKCIINYNNFQNFNAELEKIKENNIQIHHLQNSKYNNLLKECSDAPLFYFSQGNIDFSRTNVAVVGTRNITHYGKQIIDELIAHLAQFPVNIVSGFAYGVDIYTHKKAIEHRLPTIGILAHGFGTIYPSSHKKYIAEILQNGGFITEYTYDTLPVREYFLQRNRIIAGLSPITIVIESAFGGGAITTAKYAFNYNRDVFAVAGKIQDKYSQGCNMLIRNNQAQIYTRPEDISELLPTSSKPQKNRQQKLLIDLSEEELAILNHLQLEGKKQLDEITLHLQIPSYKLTSILLELEIKGFIKPSPGKHFEIL